MVATGEMFSESDEKKALQRFRELTDGDGERDKRRLAILDRINNPLESKDHPLWRCKKKGNIRKKGIRTYNTGAHCPPPTRFNVLRKVQSHRFYVLIPNAVRLSRKSALVRAL